ncbi:MAG TPA: hypothetical protein VFE62_12380 [Gemmataceae bacterium]|nr:hypothetical protein [Gemmataceae bacterium]
MPRYGTYDYDDDDFDISIGRGRRPDRDSGPKPHSGVGMVSIGFAVLSFVGYVIVFGAAVVIAANNNNNAQMQDNDPRAMALGFGILGTIGINFIGLVLGIVGCFQSDRNIVMPIFGTVLNGIFFLGLAILMCLGILAAG